MDAWMVALEQHGHVQFFLDYFLLFVHPHCGTTKINILSFIIFEEVAQFTSVVLGL